MEASPVEPEITIDHARFQRVWASIFTRTVVGDCMEHQCEMQETHTRKLDACCQYGCDVDLFERDAILERDHQIRPLLRADARAEPLFDTEVDDDPDYPSGQVVRTTVHDGGCIFLAHDRRGCAIHRASLEQGWDFNGVKPSICRLFPLTYEGNAIVIADELPEYSCAHVPGISIYRAARQALQDAFGAELVAALDAAEKSVLAGQPRRLPIA
jgi:Fe-S-cluster containining protein